MSTYTTSASSPLNPNNHIGIFISKSGIVTNGALSANFTLPYTWNIIHIGVGGDLVWEDLEGQPGVRTSILLGSVICIAARKILLTATIDGTPYTTTCQKITWGAPNNLVQIG